MKLLVCGSRDFTDQQTVHQALNKYLREHGDDLIVIHGGHKRGADAIADYWCERNEVDCMRVPAKWTVHDKAAGPIRNRRMRDRYRPDAGLAFRAPPPAKNSGTDDMIALMRAAGLPIEVIGE